MGYIELHACSAFSFLESSALPEKLAQEAARLGYPALALTDRDSLSGAPRFYKACREVGIRPIVGAEVSLRLGSRITRLPLLVENRRGYQNLCRLITAMKLRSPKGKGSLLLEDLEAYSPGLICLTGGAEGPLRTLLREKGRAAARRFLARLQQTYGRDQVYVELQRHFQREQEEENRQLGDLGRELSLPLLATNEVRYTRPQGRALLDVLTCIRHKTTLERAGRLLRKNGEAHLKKPSEMEHLFADLPEALHNSRELAQRLQFNLQDLGYRFPDYPVPRGETQDSYLRKLTEQGARQRYRPYHEAARRQIERELNLICKLQLAGYFLIVWDIVRYCQERGILVQGRGSAANSAVCYSLGITAVDPVGMDLLFERFLSEERGEWPDIDLDLPSGENREEVIQYVYQRYGRLGAAMTANVITYRARSAAREVGKVLGFPPDLLDRLSRILTSWGSPHQDLPRRFQEAGLDPRQCKVQAFLRLWRQIQSLPRHLGQHTGGMVLAQGRLDHIVPLENASMPNRTVIQWDKEDCADLGIIKVDLLGLGMMAVLQDAIQLVKKCGGEFDLAHLPKDDPQVYAMLQKADTIGVFQVESRAQMATLPRMKPTCFYDLVVEVAIIRPGPIVGQMVHPYLRRRAGWEPVTYPHPSLEPILKRTLGIPLFQEQLLRIAMVAAGFSGGEAEELRRALGFKRSEERMHEVEIKLRQGLRRNGIGEEVAETLVHYITSFALYGFPESHAASFALLAYASAYLKVHYPAVFYAALLNNQPMGFYHPATLVKDAQRHGVRVLPIDVGQSDWLCRVEGKNTIRLGLLYVSGLRQEKGKQILAARAQRPFTSLEDLQRRTRLNRQEILQLAQIGALNSLGLTRRRALWQVERVVRPAGPLFPPEADPAEDFPLREMGPQERLWADYLGTGLSVGPHPLALQRGELRSRGILSIQELRRLPAGRNVRVAGAVIVRQRPVTAKGFFFMSLEDETGIANIVVSPQLFQRQRVLLLTNSFLIARGILQQSQGVISLRATSFQALPGFRPLPSHDFC